MGVIDYQCSNLSKSLLTKEAQHAWQKLSHIRAGRQFTGKIKYAFTIKTKTILSAKCTSKIWSTVDHVCPISARRRWNHCFISRPNFTHFNVKKFLPSRMSSLYMQYISFHALAPPRSGVQRWWNRLNYWWDNSSPREHNPANAVGKRTRPIFTAIKVDVLPYVSMCVHVRLCVHAFRRNTVKYP